MVNKTVITFTIDRAYPRPLGRSASPGPFAVGFTHVAPRGVLLARVELFPYLGRELATWANVSDSRFVSERRRNYLLAYDYFKDQSLRTFPPATGANIWIAMSGRVRFVPHNDGSLPPVTANRARGRSDDLLQLLQTALE